MKAQIMLFSLSMASTVHPFAIFPSSFWSKSDAVKARGNRGLSHQQHVLLNSHFQQQQDDDQEDDGESGPASVHFCSGPSGNKRHLADHLLQIQISHITNHYQNTTDTFHPTHLSLSPDPPVRGQPLTITLNGTLDAPGIPFGSTAHVTVKLGFIKLIDKDYDVCERAGEIGKECPVEEGPLSILKTVDIPAQVPPVRCFLVAELAR